MNVASILKTNLPPDLVDALLAAFKEVESNYVLGRWKSSELDAGHFVELARRCIEYKLFGAATPLSEQLSKFSDQVMRQYENANGDESFRVHIPRVLRSVSNIRNKRGVGHVGPISPNEMDSTLILYSVKWVLAELLRLSGAGSPDEVQRAIDHVVERRLPALWKHSGPARVLTASMKASDQALVLLYDSSPKSLDDLQRSVEYRNRANFKRLLRALHSKRLIEMTEAGECYISPAGIAAAEKLLAKART